MSSIEIISLVVTLVCVVSFSLVFTILFRNYYLTNIEAVEAGREDSDLVEKLIYQDKAEKNKTKKTLKKVARISEYTLMGVVGAFFLFSLYSRFTGNALPFGKHSFIVIATDSMSMQNSNNNYLVENDLNNQFDAHDIIGVAPYDSIDDVKLYDVVAYHSTSKDKTIIVHRIRVIEELEDGTRVFHTRGDKNSVDDDNNLYGRHLTYEDIIGFYTGARIKNIGVFIIFVQSNAGIITIVSIVYCLLMFDRFNNKYEKAIEERTNTLCSITKFNPAIDEASDFVPQYKETIIFKGTCYIFEQGKFITSVPVDGLDINSYLANESVGGDINVSNPEPKVFSSSPESDSKKEESSSEVLPATSEQDETISPKKELKKRGIFKKLVKSKSDSEEHFESFLDHLDDTENIL